MRRDMEKIIISQEIDAYYPSLTLEAVMCFISDMVGEFHISYSARAVLHDLDLLTPSGNLRKKAKRILAIYHHNKFYKQNAGVVLIKPGNRLDLQEDS